MSDDLHGLPPEVVERITEILAVHSDLNPRMRQCFENLDAVWPVITKEYVHTLLTTAFWAGCEAVWTDKEFRNTVATIYREEAAA